MARSIGRIYYAAWTPLLLLAASGCGGRSEEEIRLTPVQGRILLDGQPLPHADIQLHFKGTTPESYNGASSRSDENGVFYVKSGDRLGTLSGPHTVTVSREKRKEDDAEIPSRYANKSSSKLEIDVREDRPDGYKLELTTP